MTLRHEVLCGYTASNALRSGFPRSLKSVKHVTSRVRLPRPMRSSKLQVGMERIRVLIIEENPSVRHALATRLSTIPELEVLESAGSVDEAEALIRRTAPDVILIEPKRLTGKGMPLLQALTSVPQPPLIIVLTSYHDENEALVANELGISYLLKEIDSRALVDAILNAHRSAHAPSTPS